MTTTTVKNVFLALILASALPLAACGKNETPTSPTQPGPTVSDAPPSDNRPVEIASGVIANLTRSGAGGLDAQFRIDDLTIVRATASTKVVSGSMTGQTDSLREHQTVTVEGSRTNGFLNATKITITAEAP